MKRTIWIVCGILALASSGLVAQETKPNIVLLYVDDWAWNGSSVAMHPDMVKALAEEATDTADVPNNCVLQTGPECQPGKVLAGCLEPPRPGY
jgi:hypothetical protein